MNWFKKLFAQLNDDEEHGSIEQNNAEKPEEKTIHAKVAYQYPTGKFRFPLIPDEGSLKRTKPSKQRVSSDDAYKNEKKKTVKPAKKGAEPSGKGPKKAEKIPMKKKQPFHPTEVVSPIYGNNPRPPAKKEAKEIIPEIELVSKEHENSIQVMEDSSKESTTHAPSYDSFIESDTNKIKAFSNTLLTEMEASESMEEMQTDENADVYLEVYEEIRENDNPVEEYSELESVPTTSFGQPDLNREENVEAGNSPQLDLPLLHKEKAEDTIRTEESTPLSEKETNSAQQAEEVNHDSPERVRNKGVETKNQHIPFNVIMLKQDKRSLERKNQVDETLPHYMKPPITLLSIPPQHSQNDREWVESQKQLLDETLHHFRVGAKVVKATQGPSVTQFEVQPDPGVKVNKITNLSDDIKLSLSARDIRIEAPIPGKNTIGIEVPNRVSKPVLIREIIRHPSFIQNSSPLTVALGLDIAGEPVVLDLQKMPHGLIAGATGSGKSVCVNSIIVSLLYKSTPDEVKLLLIDPKMVELTPFNHIPHLVSPVITDVKAATVALKWAVEEMERRYELFVHAGVRDITKYNETAKKHKQETLPYMVIIIDELADLMMVAPSDVEEAICRIAQKARACGMHLLIATQRPSVDVITGLIKANIPTRIAFSVSSQVDSRTIIDIGGAERLLGKGDMLLLENGAPKPIRVQGNFVSDEEIERAVSHVRKEQPPNYLFEQSELLKDSAIQEEDALFLEACQFVIDQNGASTSSLQRRFRIGYNRAARLMEMMENQGVISGPKGSKPRDVLVSEEELMSTQDSDY